VLDTIISHLPEIGSFISAVLGGGLVAGAVKVYRTYWTQLRKNDQQEHQQDLELSSRLEQRLGDVENRLDTAEAEVRKTKERLAESRLREKKLRSNIRALVSRIDDLISRLEKYESISAEERERLTEVPFSDTTDNG
jgi:chromosome segregation ATPase